jgi:hypothetical protein
VEEGWEGLGELFGHFVAFPWVVGFWVWIGVRVEFHGVVGWVDFGGGSQRWGEATLGLLVRGIHHVGVFQSIAVISSSGCFCFCSFAVLLSYPLQRALLGCPEFFWVEFIAPRLIACLDLLISCFPSDIDDSRAETRSPQIIYHRSLTHPTEMLTRSPLRPQYCCRYQPSSPAA